MLDLKRSKLSIRKQCDLLSLSRGGLYYRRRGESEENEEIMRRLDELYTEHPFYGEPRMTATLRRMGYRVNPKRVRRLMHKLGLQAIYPKRRLSVPGAEPRRYPYLLKDAPLDAPDAAWCSDITYIRLSGGFAYLVAVMDWHTRYVLSWELSISLDTDFCLAALERALGVSRPRIFNTDQGSQFTSAAWCDRLTAAGVAISMDGRGRAFDNIMIERLWRSVKYEDVYLRDYAGPREARQGLGRYFAFYNTERPHQSLGWRTPREAYRGREARHAV